MVFSLFHGRRTRERDWGESKVSQVNKTNPPPAGKSQGAAIKKIPASWEKSQWVVKKKNPRQLGEKAVGGQEKTPPTLAGKGGAGSRSKRARAKPKNTHSETNVRVISRPKEASTSQKLGLKNTQQNKKWC